MLRRRSRKQPKSRQIPPETKNRVPGSGVFGVTVTVAVAEYELVRLPAFGKSAHEKEIRRAERDTSHRARHTRNHRTSRDAQPGKHTPPYGLRRKLLDPRILDCLLVIGADEARIRRLLS